MFLLNTSKALKIVVPSNSLGIPITYTLYTENKEDNFYQFPRITLYLMSNFWTSNNSNGVSPKKLILFCLPIKPYFPLEMLCTKIFNDIFKATGLRQYIPRIIIFLYSKATSAVLLA